MTENNRQQNKHFKLDGIRGLIVCCVLIVVLFFVYVFCSIAWFSTLDQKRKADVAIILGAAAWYKRPSPVLEERLKHGLWLYNNHYVSKLIFTGGKAKNAPFSEAYVAKRYALKHGVDENDIYIEERSFNTRGNLVYASELMHQNHLTSAIIVSDPMHMRRAMLIAQSLNIQAYSSPTPSSRYDTWNSNLRMLFEETWHLIGYMLLPEKAHALNE